MSDNSAAAADTDTHALTVLNTQRRHRYGGSTSPGRREARLTRRPSS